jgi:glycosyltransferase involved in cell wall biosynthesis
MEQAGEKVGEYVVSNTIKIKVSIIVSSHREVTIDEFVSSFNSKEWGVLPVEIIIVADYDISTYTEKYPHIRWLYVPDKNIPVKRNRGIKEAKGEICAFIDDDCRPGKEWVQKAVEFLNANPEIAGVEGATRIDDCDKKEGAYKEFKRLEKQGYRTNNIFYRCKILRQVNMFDERFAFQREDVDLAYSIIESGYSIGYSPEIKVFHIFRKHEKWDLLKNCINRRFDPLLYGKHKKMYRHYIGTPYPPGILLIFALYLVSVPVMVIMSKLVLPLIILNLFVNILFTVRRAGLPMPTDIAQWIRELISFIVSPFVLIGALIYGSLRFRQLFLI